MNCSTVKSFILCLSLLLPGVVKSSQPLGCDSAILDPVYAPMSVSSLENAYKEQLKILEEKLEKIIDLPEHQRNFENTVLAFEDARDSFLTFFYPATGLALLNQSQEVRVKSQDLSSEFALYLSQLYRRKDLYKALQTTTVSSGLESDLKAEHLKVFEDSGVGLSAEQKSQVEEYQKAEGNLVKTFKNNLNESKAYLDFEQSELIGLPLSLKEEELLDGKVQVDLNDSALVAQWLSYLKLEASRKKLYQAQKSRLSQNVKVFQERVILQTKMAQLYGKKSVAHWKIDSETLAGTPESVSELLDSIKEAYLEQASPLLDQLLSLKKEEDLQATSLEPWDYAYFDRKLKERQTKVSEIDANEIKKYFSAKVVVRKLFDHIENMLGLKIIQVSEAKLWGDGVHLYRVVQPDGTLLGHFYSDLFNRDGKYPGQSYASLLVSRRAHPSSLARSPLAIMVSSLGPVDQENFLSPVQVSKVFHEFGHVLHAIFAASPYPSLSGYPQPNDAVEIPSTFLEKLAWTPEILQQVSEHVDSGEPLSQEVAVKIVEEYEESLKVGLLKGSPFMSIAYQENAIFLSILDQSIYRRAAIEGDNFDVRQVYIDEYRRFYGQDPVDGGDFIGSFFHPFFGYETDYYSYIWAHLYSTSLYDFMRIVGIVNPFGYLQIRELLESDGRAQLTEIYHRFIGGPPSVERALERAGFAP